jgi:hypothetical protein
VVNEAELRKMTSAQRRELARTLAAIDYPKPLFAVNVARGRRLGLLISVSACAGLAGWIIILALSLHRGFHTQHWKGAWVGFDLLELLGFAATAWAFWRGRQIVIACLLVTGTLLCCDAWFDVILDLGTRDEWGSAGSALLIELPLAFLLFRAAFRLIRLSALVAVGGTNEPGPPAPRIPLWKIPLFGTRPAAVDPAPVDPAGGDEKTAPVR